MGGGYHRLRITLGDSGFQRLRGEADDAGELLGVGLDEVGGGAVEAGDESGQRRVGGVDRDLAVVAGELSDDVGVPVVGHARRKRSRHHHPQRLLGVADDRACQRVDGGRVKSCTGLVDLGCSAVHFGDGDVRPHRRRDRDTAERNAAGLKGGHHRVGAGRGQQRDGVDAGQREGASDVDALAAGFGGDRADPVYRTAGERRGERDGAVDARIRGDGDDHATTTSMPCSVSCVR
jgi:hypothetical protein